MTVCPISYHFTTCFTYVFILFCSEGYIAIVHDPVISYKDTIPWLVEEENTLNWFRVFWENGSFPGDSEANTCADNVCKTLGNGR